MYVYICIHIYHINIYIFYIYIYIHIYLSGSFVVAFVSTLTPTGKQGGKAPTRAWYTHDIMQKHIHGVGLMIQDLRRTAGIYFPPHLPSPTLPSHPRGFGQIRRRRQINFRQGRQRRPIKFGHINLRRPSAKRGENTTLSRGANQTWVGKQFTRKRCPSSTHSFTHSLTHPLTLPPTSTACVTLLE